MAEAVGATGETSVHEVVLTGQVDDVAWPGAVITRALCRHWQHDGPCRWPHHNEAIPHPGGLTVRTVFVASRDEQPEVLGRIAAALEAEPAWRVSSLGPTGPRPDERALWERLSTSR